MNNFEQRKVELNLIFRILEKAEKDNISLNTSFIISVGEILVDIQKEFPNMEAEVFDSIKKDLEEDNLFKALETLLGNLEK